MLELIDAFRQAWEVSWLPRRGADLLRRVAQEVMIGQKLHREVSA
jgi:hypothetical protein